MQPRSNSANGDAPVARECESELLAITRALEGAHLLIGIAGLILGASAGSLLLLAGVGPFAASPALTLLSTTVLGAALGLWFGGATALGPGASAEQHRYHQYQ